MSFSRCGRLSQHSIDSLVQRDLGLSRDCFDPWAFDQVDEISTFFYFGLYVEELGIVVSILKPLHPNFQSPFSFQLLKDFLVVLKGDI